MARAEDAPPSGLTASIENFIREANALDAREAEERLLPLLVRVMKLEGFDLVPGVRPDGSATDYVGQASPGGPQRGRVGVEYKHYRSDRPVDGRPVAQVINIMQRSGLDRALLLSKSGFTRAAYAAAGSEAPAVLELLTLDQFKDLAVAERVDGNVESPVKIIVRAMSEKLAYAIAADPHALDEIEWRDLERLLAVVFQGLGFDAELTPAAKDGGKDLVLRLTVNGKATSFAIEVKHWRSGKVVGSGPIKDFVEVVAREQHENGLFLSTSGYSANVTESLTEVERKRVRLAGEAKVVNLCQTFVRHGQRLWRPDNPGRLPDLLLSETL